MKKKVLVVSFTNQAVDNVLVRLKESGFYDFVRITNNLESVDLKVQGHVVTTAMCESMQFISKTLQSYVYGCTCLQMTNGLLTCIKGFDYCIMDEAS